MRVWICCVLEPNTGISRRRADYATGLYHRPEQQRTKVPQMMSDIVLAPGKSETVADLWPSLAWYADHRTFGDCAARIIIPRPVWNTSLPGSCCCCRQALCLRRFGCYNAGQFAKDKNNRLKCSPNCLLYPGQMTQLIDDLGRRGQMVRHGTGVPRARVLR